MSALLHVCAPCTHPRPEKRGPVKAGELFATRLAAEVAARPELADLRVVAAPCIGNCAARCRLPELREPSLSEPSTG
jgi:hypothetical protein